MKEVLNNTSFFYFMKYSKKENVIKHTINIWKYKNISLSLQCYPKYNLFTLKKTNTY
ncbi:hypothetical protein SAMN05216455_1017 [Segatella bryantii]|nr:hypothetical protein SAMN04487899_106212 [Segatella bryantii]SDZ74259.1 hypothetical protein SAMN05216455_1017 [Segatella bryantii]